MSRFNLPPCENKSLSNYVNTEKSLGIADIKDLRKLPNMPEYINRGHNAISNNFSVTNSNYGHNEDNDLKIKKGRFNIESTKPVKNKIAFEDESLKLISAIRESNEDASLYENHTSLSTDIMNSNNDIDNENESIPLVNIYSTYNNHNNKNIINNSMENYREPLCNKIPQRMFVSDIQDLSAISSIPVSYINGYHLSQIKNVSTFGSSFVNNSHHQAMFAIQNPQYLDRNNFHNYPTHIKTQNVYFTQQIGNSVDHNSNEDFSNGSENSKKINVNKESNIKIADSRKEAILIQQPECYETDTYTKMTEICLENLPNNSIGEPMESGSGGGMMRENLIPVDYFYPNNCYGQPFPISDNRKNISYISQQMPLQLIPLQGPVVLNNNINPNYSNIHYPHYCLAPVTQNLISFPSEKTKIRNSTPSEQKVKNIAVSNPSDLFVSRNDSFDESQLFHSSDPITSQQKSEQQFPPNSDFFRVNSYPLPTSNEPGMSYLFSSDQTGYQNISQLDLSFVELDKSNDKPDGMETVNTNTNSPDENRQNYAVKKIGKFIVTPVSNSNEPVTTVKSTDDTRNPLNYNQNLANESTGDNRKLDRPQQHSRFKKTRIRETVERWCMNGLNTYDCRFKIIPSKIMTFYNSNPDYISKEMDINQNCDKCETHDKERFCYDVDYHKKEFKFWQNGNHINLCSELEEKEGENYCQFHAKIIKRLNQNQNLSLSKYLNNTFNYADNTNLSTPQIFQTVLISSPEHDNYIINIDTQASHVLLSAPPVSPSVMNTASMSSLPTNVQSPRSTTAMVMLKCATPVLLSNATRNATLLNESISIEKINHMASVNMSMESDSNSVCGQQIHDNTPLIDLWQSSPRKSDQLAYVAGTVITDNSNIDGEICNHQHSLYPIGHMSPLYYPVYQQSLPSISTTMIGNKCHDRNSFLPNIDENSSLSSDNLPDGMLEEINKTTNSFKSIITNIFQIEHSKLLSEIEMLRKSNKQLANELVKMKSRSDNLEKLLRGKHGFTKQLNSIDTEDVFEKSTCLNKSRGLTPELQHSEIIDYDSLI